MKFRNIDGVGVKALFLSVVLTMTFKSQIAQEFLLKLHFWMNFLHHFDSKNPEKNKRGGCLFGQKSIDNMVQMYKIAI